MRDRQRACLTEAFNTAGSDSLSGFRVVMLGIMDASARAWIDGPPVVRELLDAAW